jgi:group II intron reverse transcriptase/maturase/CRISPR-associated endonuclease Cas1
MILPNFPNLTGLVVTVKFLSKTEFNLNHEMALDAFLRHSLNLGEDYTKYLSIITPENGRLFYRESDPYRFVVIATGDKKQTEPLWQKIIKHLRRLPNSAPVKDPQVPLRDNIKLESLNDLFDGIAVSNEHSLDAYTMQRAIEQGVSWHQASNLTQQPLKLQWFWQSSVRLLKENHKEYKGEQRFIRQASQLTVYLLLKRIYETLNNVATLFGLKINQITVENHQKWLIEQAQFIEINTPDLYWIDTPYFDKEQQKNTMGGMAGNFTLILNPGVEPGLLAMLILSQMVGTGQRRTSGLGKYWLQHNLKASNLIFGLKPNRIVRQQSLLQHMTQPHIIAKAMAEIEQKPNIDKLTERTKAQVNSALGQILKQDYHPPSLQGFTISKKDGEERLLAVSPLYDRILQKATAIILTPGLDAIMSQSSYGYRKGLSRQQVRYDIQNAYRQGYKWVYESDIEDFFDSIDRQQLTNRLKSLLGEDPLWQLLENWLGQDIHYQNTTIKRPKGLPQGSPLSPLLANFILDDFDSDLETHGFKMIRYADDFIILCKSQHEARLASEAVKQSLKEVQLTTNADKTHIVELSQGFKFLGYLFREDHAIEIGGEKADGRTSFSAKQTPANLPSWLANLGDKQLNPIPDEDSPQNEIGKIEQQGTYLVLAGDAQFLTTDNHNLIVKKDDTITHKINWEQLHAITLIGLHHMTLPAQHQALANKIPVHFADRTGHYLGALTSFTPAQNNYKNWFIQLQMSDNQDYALSFSKAIVISRLHNQRTTLLRRKDHRKQLQPTLQQLKKLQYKVNAAKSLASLNGLEGAATRQYFQSFNQFLPEWARFKKRTRRPPQDPFNVLLSLGYTILYSHVDSILQSAGFMTWKGIYHQQSPAHAALASDIMESYRHLIERHALHVINQGRIKQEDFREEPTATQKKQLRLSAEARRRYITGLINRFQSFNKEQTLHQHIYSQAQQLKQTMQNHKPFKPYKELK